MTLTFRCPAELEGVLPPPLPAALGLPAWLKAMPAQAFSALNGQEENTVKRCPPFVNEAMTHHLEKSPLARSAMTEIPPGALI